MGLIDRVLERYQDHWFARAEARASKDPEWAAIEIRRHDADHPDLSIMLSDDRGLTRLEWDRQEEIFRRVNGECPVTPWRDVIRKHGLGAQRRRLSRFIQRGRRGWANEDTWNLDSYLSGVIASSIEHLRDHGNGYPADLAEEGWKDVLTRISAGFRANAEPANVESPVANRDLDEAFNLLRRWFPCLWD